MTEYEQKTIQILKENPATEFCEHTVLPNSFHSLFEKLFQKWNNFRLKIQKEIVKSPLHKYLSHYQHSDGILM